jgi:hypothetical protein
MSQLRTVFTTRRREVAIFSSVKICPRVKYSNVFRCFRYTLILDLVGDLVCFLRVNSTSSCAVGEANSFKFELRRFAASSKRWLHLFQCNSLRLLWAVTQVNETIVRLKCESSMRTRVFRSICVRIGLQIGFPEWDFLRQSREKQSRLSKIGDLGRSQGVVRA